MYLGMDCTDLLMENQAWQGMDYGLSEPHPLSGHQNLKCPMWVHGKWMNFALAMTRKEHDGNYQ